MDQQYKNLAVLLPLATLVLLYRFWRARDCERYESVMLAAVMWGALIALITELLSARELIRYWQMVVAWLACCAILIGALRMRPSTGKPESENFRANALALPEKLLLTYLCATVIFLAALAWIAPPNTWDSMTYHMSRVMHWIQDRSVNFYPTAILRQLHSNPWAEYAILNFQILTGSDRLANFVQWLAMVGSLFGVAAIAKEFGATFRVQLFSAVVCASIPMGILQSTSTQTDYVVAFWLVCFAYFTTRFVRRNSQTDSIGLGLSLGLALLTKGTAYIYAFPFVLWLSCIVFKRRDMEKAVLVGLALALAVVVNFGHYARNFDLYGKPLGPGREDGGDFVYTNQVKGVGVTLSNMLRNGALHLSFSDSSDRFLEDEIYSAHKYLGVLPNDPRTTWPTTKFKVQGLSHNEDDAGNGAHFVLMVFVAGFLLIFMRKNLNAATYMGCLILGFVTFSAALKWQPWHSRLQLPLFVLWSPIVGVVLALPGLRKISAIPILALMICSVPSLLYSSTKPVLGEVNIFDMSRDDLYFIKRPNLISSYKAAGFAISKKGCLQIGLAIGGDDWEYPLWVLLKNKNKNARLEHVNVNNVSLMKIGNERQHGDFNPCAILTVGAEAASEVQVQGETYLRALPSGPVNLFMPKSTDSHRN